MTQTCALCIDTATHYCPQDDAFLCRCCTVSIHSANALASRHKVVSLAAQVDAPVVSQVHSAASAAPLLVKEEPDTYPDSLSTEFGVVPDISESAAQVDFNTLQVARSSWDKVFDMFDLDSGWMEKADGGLADFQFPEFGDSAGLVPSCKEPESNRRASTSNYVSLEEPIFVESMVSGEDSLGDWDLVVPTFVFGEARPPAPAPVIFSNTRNTPSFQMPTPIVRVSPGQAARNRAERVALHREKKKNRTFEKTIRYASRKAYAEVRPRIKGRFATKEEVTSYKAAQAQGNVCSIEEWAAGYDALCMASPT